LIIIEVVPAAFSAPGDFGFKANALLYKESGTIYERGKFCIAQGDPISRYPNAMREYPIQVVDQVR